MGFRDAVSESNVAFMIGSGVSALTTQGAPTATWVGLIRDGAERAVSLNPTLGSSWLDAFNAIISADDEDAPLTAASMVAKKLKAIGSQAFANWLAESVGELEIKDDSVAKALLDYPFPILTTNYDTLLEAAGGRRGSTDWTDPSAFHNSITRENKSIAHLHGIWNKPDSVVLTEGDYERVLNSESTQQITRALSTLKSIVYVGFGAGMDDPNFAALREWRRCVFPNSGTTHYRLCRTGDLQRLQREHANDNVMPVAYGNEYSDLATFLRENLPKRDELIINDAGLARDVSEDARVHLRETMIADSVLMEAGASDLESRDLIVTPVFLPVPHATFVQAQAQARGDEQGEVAPIDAMAEVKAHDFFVVVGDEGSGLTTAVKWLAAESSAFLSAAAPIFVRYSDCRIRHAPLEYAINNVAISLGLIGNKGESLPDYVLALDDYTLAPTAVSASVISHLVNCSAIVKIVGCAQGDEERIVSRLAELGVRPRVLYLGRMRRADVQVLAERIAPGDGKRLTREVMRVLEAEGLRRNPMTVSLLLYLVYRNAPREVLNQTSLVDAYLSLILVGIGDPRDNLGLSEGDIDAILSGLAEKVVRMENPSLPETDIVENIADTLGRFGWDTSGSASDVLQFLLRRRVLVKHGEVVEFARYSYLTLYAAKRAVVSSEFHELVIGDAFYYSPVVKRLAALTRSDRILFATLRGLLTEELSSSPIEGLPFELVEEEVASGAPPILDVPNNVGANELDIEGDFEVPESDSPGSFGLVKSEMSAADRVSRTVRLASSILRDLDQIEELQEKRALLVMILELWGRLISTLSSDPFIRDLEMAVLRDMEDEGDGSMKPQMREFIARSLPAGAAFGGMESELASPKLASVLNQAISNRELSGSQESIIGALFLLALIQPRGWEDKARSLVNESEPTWVLVRFFLIICENIFVRSANLNDELLELCKDIFMKSQNFGNANLRSASMDVYVRRLRTSRVRAQQAG